MARGTKGCTWGSRCAVSIPERRLRSAALPDRRMRHRNGAHVASPVFGSEHCQGGTGHVAAGATRQIVYTLFHGETHQVMSGRVEFDLVSPSAVPVVRAQHRRVLVRHVCPLNRLCLSKRPTEGVLLSAGPCCSLADYRLTQRPVGRKQVVLGERTRLIQDFVIHDSYVTPASPSGDRLMGPVGVPKAIREDWACCADGRRNSPASFPDAGHAWHRVEPAQPLYLDRPVSVGDVKGYVQATPPALGLRSRSIWARTRG